MSGAVSFIRRAIQLLPILSAFAFLPGVIDGVDHAKLLFLLIAVALVCLCFSLDLFVNAETSWKFVKTDIATGLLSLAFLIAGLANAYVHLETWLIFIIYYFLLSHRLSDKAPVGHRYLLWSILSVASVEAVVGILQTYSLDPVGLSGYFKVVGTFGNPDHFAGFIVPAVPVGLSLYHTETTSQGRRAALLLTLTVVFILPAAFIRSSWLAVAVGVATFYGLKNGSEIRKFFGRGKLSSILPLVAVPFIGVIGYLLYILRPMSAIARLLIWRLTWNIVKQHPIFGIGYDDYAVQYMNFQAKFFQRPINIENYAMVAGNVNMAHNEYLQLFAEAGIIGLLCFLFVIFFVYRDSLRAISVQGASYETKTYLAGSLGGLAAILTSSFFSFPLHIVPTMVVFFSLLASASSIEKGASSRREGSAGRIFSFTLRRFGSILLSLVLFTLSMFLFAQVHNEFASYRVWTDAFRLSLSGQYSESIARYRSVYATLNGNGKFHFMLGGTYVAAGMYREGVSELEKSRSNYNDPEIYIALGTAYEKVGNLQKAIANYTEAGYMMPHWMYPHYLMANLYYKNHDLEKSWVQAKTVVNMPIKVESQAVDQMKSEMRILIDKIRCGKS